MSADQLLQLASQALFVVVFLVVAVRAVRQRWRTTVDVALLFGVASVIIAETWVLEAIGAKTQPPLLAATSSTLLMSLSYLLLRLVDDFTELPSWAVPAATLGFAIIAVSLFALPLPYPGPAILIYVVYFVGLALFSSLSFARAVGRSSGVTRRRMQAAALGSLCLGLTILLAGVQSATSAWTQVWAMLTDLSALACGLAYYLGFAPPRWLRRSWQEPEVRAFLGRAAAMPRLPSTAAIVEALEVGAARSLGVPRAVIGLWDEAAQVLRYNGIASEVVTAPDALLGGKAFSTQQPIFSPDAIRDDPAHADRYRRGGAAAVLAAPITAGAVRLGVLAVYAPRAPIFADDDLILVRLLADQAAVILESRALIDEAARVRAREEATRLKDDFLSAAAHDLKTPLTALVAQTQLMERRASRHPDAPADVQAIAVVVKEAQRLKRLVLELLDGTRVEQGRLVGQRERVDLVELAREACARHSSEQHRCVLEADGPVFADLDQTRTMQLIDNLLENAVQYSPQAGEVRVAVSEDGGTVSLTVTDQGIGIPMTDLPFLFERFHRGANVDDRAFAGLGLGLYICRGIVEGHGGRIWATSPGPGCGSTFHVILPVAHALAHTPAREGTPAMATAGEGR